MDTEIQKGIIQESEASSVDISDRVRAMFECTELSLRERQKRELYNISDSGTITLTIDYTNLEDAEWVKAWIANYGFRSRGQKREASIRATRLQYDEAANVFGSGVKWIEN